MASRALKRQVTPKDETGRQFGKTYDLAFGFGGGLGAWRRFDDSDAYSDAEVEHFKQEFRRTHLATVRFWRAARTRRPQGRHHSPTRRLQPVLVHDGRRDPVADAAERHAGCTIRRPGWSLGNSKIPDNSASRTTPAARWSDVDAWYGILVENVVQATARDILAEAMRRIEAAGYPVVLPCARRDRGRGAGGVWRRRRISPP